jgi:predicted DNA-binding protein (UPF0251 family)
MAANKEQQSSEPRAAESRALRPRKREAKKRRPPYGGGFSVKNSHTSPRRVALRKNQSEALQLRRSGRSFDEIAARMKRPRATIHRWITDALEEMIQEPAQAVLKLELQRLDAYLAAYHAAAVQGDLQATDMALKILEKRCRLLGLFPKEGQHSAAMAVKIGDDDGAPKLNIKFVLPGQNGELDHVLEPPPIRDASLTKIEVAPRRDYDIKGRTNKPASVPVFDSFRAEKASTGRKLQMLFARVLIPKLESPVNRALLLYHLFVAALTKFATWQSGMC